MTRRCPEMTRVPLDPASLTGEDPAVGAGFLAQLLQRSYVLMRLQRPAPHPTNIPLRQHSGFQSSHSLVPLDLLKDAPIARRPSKGITAGTVAVVAVLSAGVVLGAALAGANSFMLR